VNVQTLARKAAKAAVLPAGVSGRRRSGDVVMVLYHRVGRGEREIDLPVEQFERHLEHLTSADRVLSLDDALGGDHDGGVVLTFDDGTGDFHEFVLPLLVRYRVPAVLYAATGLIGEHAGTDPDLLTWGQLQEAVRTGLVTIGSHTHSHADLTRSTEAEAGEEMRRSKDLVEDHLGVSCRHFAYPWAVGSPAADRAARRLFASAALDAWRTNRRGEMDPYRLGRVPILRSDGLVFFKAKTRGVLDSEALVYRALGRGPWGRT
jgi:peptidoglycan/xylan/chitin deacetylase (PgdA/CDA1 family)